MRTEKFKIYFVISLQEWEIKIAVIKDFAVRVDFDISCDFSDEKSVEYWLYNELKNANILLVNDEKKECCALNGCGGTQSLNANSENAAQRKIDK